MNSGAIYICLWHRSLIMHDQELRAALSSQFTARYLNDQIPNLAYSLVWRFRHPGRYESFLQ